MTVVREIKKHSSAIGPLVRQQRLIGLCLVLAVATPQSCLGFTTQSAVRLQPLHKTFPGRVVLGNNNNFSGGRSNNNDWSRLSMSAASSATSAAAAANKAIPPPPATFDSAMKPHLAVSLDQPLLPKPTIPTMPSFRTPELNVPTVNIDTSAFRSKILKSIAALLASDVFKVAALAFCFAFSLSLLSKSGISVLPALQSIPQKFSKLIKVIKGTLSRFSEKTFTKKKKSGTPMTFDDNVNDGWGTCTLKARKKIGKSSFEQFEFTLPSPDNVLPLDLGQQISLCCLDNNNHVAKGEFYPYVSGKHAKLGSFSILTPNYDSSTDNDFALGNDAANFARVLRDDLKVGDEVALKMGAHKLDYRGQYLPVTDMLYVACSTGIVPVMEQVKAVLPNGSSSVKSVSVIWVNPATKDFDVTAEQLENLYFQHSTKLAVSCIVDNLQTNTVEDNAEITAALPDFIPGTMAVLAGPPEVARKTRAYLISRGYPEDCICVL